MSPPGPLSKQAEVKITSLLRSIPVPCFVDFSRIDEVRRAVDCDGYWKRAAEKEQKNDYVAQPLPDINKLKVQNNVKAINQPDFSDLAIKNPSQRLREKARRRSQQITVEPEIKKPVTALAPSKPVTALAPSKPAIPKPTTVAPNAMPILSARDRRIRPIDPTTSASNHYEPSSSTRTAVNVNLPPSAPITRSMTRRSASTTGSKDPAVPAIRPRRSESVKSDGQPPFSRRFELNSPAKSGLTRRPSNLINYFLSEKTISSVASIGRKLRSVSRGRS